MEFATVKEMANALFGEARFIGRIANEEEYAQALALMSKRFSVSPAVFF